MVSREHIFLYLALSCCSEWVVAGGQHTLRDVGARLNLGRLDFQKTLRRLGLHLLFLLIQMSLNQHPLLHVVVTITLLVVMLSTLLGG